MMTTAESPTAASSVFLRCKKCSQILGDTNTLCFYTAHTTAIHLIIKTELYQSLLDGPDAVIKLAPQSDPKRMRISDYEALCRACGTIIGMVAKVGFRKEELLCFSRDPCCLLRDGEALAGKWSTLRDFVLEIEKRDSSSLSHTSTILVDRPSLMTCRPTIENLAGLYIQDLVVSRPRHYQVECLMMAALRSSIVYLPTGAGKTLVAAMLIGLMHHLNPLKTIFFVVDRVPLAFQQSQYILEQTGLNVIVICGENVDDISHRNLHRYAVIVLTAQVLINLMSDQVLRVDDASLIVFDEIHHAVKSHPYVILLKNFIKPSVDQEHGPLLLGLSASPISGSIIEMESKLADLLHLSGTVMCMPCIYWEDLMAAINRPKMDYRIVENGEEDSQMSTIIEDYFRSILIILQKELAFRETIDAKSLINIEMVRGSLRALMERAHIIGNQKAAELSFHLHHVVSAQEINSVLGPRYAVRYINELVSRDQTGMPTEVLEKLISSSSLLDTLSGKVQVLLNILASIKLDDTTRALIFVQTKRTARYLCEILQDHPEIADKWRPETFVGQATGQLDGMSWIEKQAPLLQGFRQGSTRLLISTSVLEEGMDVPICNYVILFDQAWTLTSIIQTRGRARAKQSQYILICNELQRAAYEGLVNHEHEMRKIIAKSMAESRSLSKDATMLSILVNRKLAVSPTLKLAEPKANYQLQPLAGIELRIYYFANCSINLSEPLKLNFLATLCQVQIHHKDDLLLGPTKVVSVKGRFPRYSTTRINEVGGLLIEAQKTLYLQGFIAFTLNTSPSSDYLALNAERLDMGALVTPFLFNAVSTLKSLLKVILDPTLGILHIFHTTSELKVFRTDVKFTNIENFIIAYQNAHDETCTELYIPLRGSCNYYCSQMENESEVRPTNLDSFAWYVATEGEVSEFLDVVDKSCLRLCLLTSRTVNTHLVSVLRALEDYGIEILYGHVDCHEVMENMLCKNDFELAGGLTEDFEETYQLLVLYSMSGRKLLYRIRRDFLARLLNLTKGTRQMVLSKLVLDLPFLQFVQDDDLASLIEKYSRYATIPSSFDDKVPFNITHIKYILITPTRLIHTQPKPMMMNRVLRAFNPEYFLRVNFRDEALEKLQSTRDNDGMKKVFARIADFLHKGLKIGNRQYEYLAMSSSQLRDHSCWFICPYHDENGKLINANYIHSWCGEFGQIKNIAKLVARLGQSFSTSTETIQIANDQYTIIPDYKVEVEDGGRQRKYIFSDGIGKISLAMARLLTLKMGYDQIPTAFQIRYAGFKGVLAIDPYSSEDDPIKVEFRSSMKKFESSHTTLEVLNYSQFIPCYLNRQIILIMSSLGVPDKAFLKLQDQMMAELSRMLLETTVGKQAMLSRLLDLLPAFKDFNSRELVEPFMRSILQTVYQYQMTELLTKSRIFVPKGRILMGVIDDTGELQEGELFIQISRQPYDEDAIKEGLLVSGRDNRLIVTTEVAIAKNPCMHPGDLRKLVAVRNNLLERYHYDCIVFPRHGQRPITDMCSGSDLDGDLYFVTWDPSLLPPYLYPPMDYEAKGAQEINEITKSHIIDFIVDFISNNQLGQFANAHIAHSDLKEEGLADELCIKLAYMFSMAVDFPKTGYVPNFPKEARVKSWPDFMQKQGVPTHRSNKIIGKLFRRVKSAYDAKINSLTTIQLQSYYLIDGYEKHLDWAYEMYSLYAEQLVRNLKLSQVFSEAQVFSGCLTDSFQLSKDETRDSFKILVKKVKLICDDFRNRFIQAVKDGDDTAPRASACYYVTCTNPLTFPGISGPILSFPWLFAEHLPRSLIMNDQEPICTIGRQIISTVQGIIRNEIELSLLERINFVTLLRQSLPESIDLRLTGSCRTWLLGPRSDINLVINNLDKKVIEMLSKLFSVRLDIIEQSIYYKGKPFSFTITSQEEGEKELQVSNRLRSSLLADPVSLMVLLILLKWARHLALVRDGDVLKGKIKVTAFALLCLHLLERMDSLVKIDHEMESNSVYEASLLNNWVEKIQQEISIDVSTVAKSLFLVLKRLAFDDMDDLLRLIKLQSEIRINVQMLVTLKEAAFQAFQYLAQTLDITCLWNLPQTDLSHREPAQNKRKFKLAKRSTPSATVFMNGCSLLLFEGSKSPNDAVTFNIYKSPIVSHHHILRYTPHLLYPSDLNTDPLYLVNEQCPLYNEYFAHAYRQLTMARQLTESANSSTYSGFGQFRLSIKFGSIYLTNLSRLFIEDRTSAIIAKVREALELGLVRMGDSSTEHFLREVGTNFVLELPHKLPKEGTETVKQLLNVTPSYPKSEIDENLLRSIVPVTRKKVATLSPMSAFFEPFLSEDLRLRTFISTAGFRLTGTRSQYMISAMLFNSTSKSNCQIRVFHRADDLAFIKMHYRPIRWILINVKGMKDGDGADPADYRIVLTSAMPILPTDKSNGDMNNDLMNSIQQGIFTIDQSTMAPILKPEFRTIERIMIRRANIDTFTLPDASAITQFITDHQNLSLQYESAKLLGRVQVDIAHIIDYGELDPQTGRFLHVREKIETTIHSDFEEERDFTPESNRLIISTFWKLAQLFKGGIYRP